MLRVESLERRDLLAITPQALLPDLTPWANSAKGFIYGWTIVGNDLRLTTAMANIGTGPMELRGGATHGESQDVYQRVYEPNGSFTDTLAGTFTYHPEHGHIHFDNFAQFRLRQVLPGGGVGDIVAAGPKVSFCLLDVERFNTTGPSSPQFLNCGQIQGISVGWADVYSRGLEGQSIEITNVPDGNYWLEVVVDPDNRIMESNETNNVTRIQIALTRPPGGGGAITPDVFEPNNSFDAASILAPPEDHVYDNLSIHASLNADYYRVTASASGPMAFRLAFLHSQGDIDMEVFDSTRTRIGRSDSNLDSEQFSFNAVAGQFYYVRVYGYNGATNPNYTFTVDQPEGVSGGLPDQFEDNDTFATARSLSAVDQTYTNLNVNTSNDDDYYKIVPTTSGTMAVSLAFLNAQGDLDLEIYNASQTRLAQSATTSDGEQLSLAVTAGQTYVVRAFGFSGATNANYSMTIDVPAVGPVIPPDALEQNDTLATARLLAAVNQTINNLSIDATGDDDYYKIVPTSSGTMSVNLAFLHAQGDVDMELLNASGTRLALSDSTNNSEQASVAVTAGQTYYIRVYGYLGAVNPNYSMTVGVPVQAASVVTYLSMTGGGTYNSTDGSPQMTLADSDIFKLTVQSNGKYGYSLHLDGSDVGLTTSDEDIDAFAFLPDGSIVISTTGAYSVPGAGGTTITGGGEDLLRFVPTSLGDTTAGTWSMYFDGSDVGLSGGNENIDAVAVLADGRILASTTGVFSVNGGVAGDDEDLIAFTPTSLGANTAGTWAMYFDGSDVGLSTNDGEDVNGLSVRENPGGNPTLYLSTVGDFAVTGASGANEDIVAFTPTTLGANTTGTFASVLAFDGSVYGLSAWDLDGYYVAPPAAGALALGQSVATSSALLSGASLAASTATSSTSVSRQTVPSSQTGSGSSAKNTALLATVSSTSKKASTASTGTSSQPVKAAATSGTGSDASLTVWDHIANSLDEVLPSLRKRR